MTWHLIIVFVNYRACFPWFSSPANVLNMCPVCPLVSRLLSKLLNSSLQNVLPKTTRCFCFLAADPNLWKKEDFHPSEFPVVIVLLTDKVVVSYSVHIAGFCAVGLTVSMLFVDFVGASNAVLHYFLQNEIIQEKQADNVQYNRPIYDFRVDSLLRQVEGCSSWSRSIVLFSVFFSLLYWVGDDSLSFREDHKE